MLHRFPRAAVYVFWLIISLVTLAADGYANNCDEAYQSRLRSDMSLSYEAFDQTQGQGFRALAQMGCEKQAADLIEAYIRANRPEQSSLRWHIAQLRASHGDYESAIDYANQTLRKKENFSENPLRWNDYVLATVGFLERNKDKLEYHRDRVAAAGDEHPGNALNAKLLDSLIQYFDYNYKYATSRIE